MNKPNKPLSVAHSDFCQSLLKLINESGLPPIMIQPIIDEVRGMVANAAKEQLEKDSESYKKQLALYQEELKKSEECENAEHDTEAVR